MKIGILDMYMYLPILALIIGIGFVFFSEDRFRYECQDPVNWGTEECTPPVCKAAGLCTEDLIKIETSTIEEIITEKVTTETTDTTIIDTPQDILSNIENPECNCKEEDLNAQ
jgi:hypothetical protein